MRRKAISNIMFYFTTVLLILTIVFCIGSTVKSESSNETQLIIWLVASVVGFIAAAQVIEF